MSKLPKIIEVKQTSTNLTHITWIVNNICHNRCSYCPPILHAGSNHNYEWDNARKFLNLLFKRYTKLHFSIGGGEPSMSPFFPELVKLIYDQGHTITLTSNAYKNTDYWKEIAPFINSISFSYHPEFSTEKYFENVIATADITRVNARVMMLSSHWDKSVDAFTRLSAYNTFYTEIVRIYDWGTNNDSDQYTDQQLEWISNTKPHYMSPNNPHKNKPWSDIGAVYIMDDGTTFNNSYAVTAINNGQTNFLGYECELGLRSLFISSQGEIKRGNCGVGGIIGNINQPDLIQWPSEPVICPYTVCGCTSDVNINKRLIV